MHTLVIKKIEHYKIVFNVIWLIGCILAMANRAAMRTPSTRTNGTRATRKTFWWTTASPVCRCALCTITTARRVMSWHLSRVSGEIIAVVLVACAYLWWVLWICRRNFREAGGRGRAGLVQGTQIGQGRSLSGQLRGECVHVKPPKPSHTFRAHLYKWDTQTRPRRTFSTHTHTSNQHTHTQYTKIISIQVKWQSKPGEGRPVEQVRECGKSQYYVTPHQPHQCKNHINRLIHFGNPFRFGGVEMMMM